MSTSKTGCLHFYFQNLLAESCGREEATAAEMTVSCPPHGITLRIIPHEMTNGPASPSAAPSETLQAEIALKTSRLEQAALINREDEVVMKVILHRLGQISDSLQAGVYSILTLGSLQICSTMLKSRLLAHSSAASPSLP